MSACLLPDWIQAGCLSAVITWSVPIAVTGEKGVFLQPNGACELWSAAKTARCCSFPSRLPVDWFDIKLLPVLGFSLSLSLSGSLKKYRHLTSGRFSVFLFQIMSKILDLWRHYRRVSNVNNVRLRLDVREDFSLKVNILLLNGVCLILNLVSEENACKNCSYCLWLLLSTCGSVLEQDTEPQLLLVLTLNSGSLPSLCEHVWMAEWKETCKGPWIKPLFKCSPFRIRNKGCKLYISACRYTNKSVHLNISIRFMEQRLVVCQ